jgi:hypothetical protein
MAEIRIHPAALLFPMISDADFPAFLDGVRRNGIQQNMVFVGDSLNDSELLDGRNRLKAIEILGLDYSEYVDLKSHDEVPDPVAFVMSLNQDRRHLTDSQRAAVAAKCAAQSKLATDTPIGDEADATQKTAPAITQKQAAKIMGASE